MKPYYEHGGITIYHGDCWEDAATAPEAVCRAALAACAGPDTK